MSPTYDGGSSRFRAEYKRLSPEQKKAFKAALGLFVAGVTDRCQFHPSLRVKHVQSTRGVWEMSWAPDGRATFTYGEEIRPGVPHVIWRRVGTHGIFDEP